MEQNDWRTQTSSASSSLTTCNSCNKLIAISGRPFDFEGVGKSAEWSRLEALLSVLNDAEEWDRDLDLDSGLDMETTGEWGGRNWSSAVCAITCWGDGEGGKSLSARNSECHAVSGYRNETRALTRWFMLIVRGWI